MDHIEVQELRGGKIVVDHEPSLTQELERLPAGPCRQLRGVMQAVLQDLADRQAADLVGVLLVADVLAGEEGVWALAWGGVVAHVRIA